MSYISDGTQKPVQMRHTTADALESLATMANRHSAAILQLPRCCSSFPANSAAAMRLLAAPDSARQRATPLQEVDVPA